MKDNITTIAFDADDTLWINELYFHEAEKQFCTLLENYHSHAVISQELFNTEMKNLPIYGYGIKGFTLCMIETANRITACKAPASLIDEIIKIGHALLDKPIEILDGVVETLDQLTNRYKLIVATKGDLLDQERKLEKSGLATYFHHIEIMSDKKVSDYAKLLRHLDCNPSNFLMLGNSIKSDSIPPLELGGFSAHIPYHLTWTHEQHEEILQHPNFIELKRIDSILTYLL